MFNRRDAASFPPRPLLWLLSVVLTLGAALAFLLPSAQAGPEDNQPPTNIACQGWEEDTVLVSWKDNDDDEQNYRVERRIGTGAWSEVATISPNADGNYEAYRDTGADVSTQNRRYRVRAYHSDGSYSDYSPVCNNRRIFETANYFRLFYGLRATSDDCPLIDGQEVCLADTNSGGSNVYVQRQANALEGSVAAFDRLGFDRSAGGPPSGLDRIPVNVVWCDGGGCAGGSSLGLSPFLMEMPFDLATRAGDPVAYLVALHEAFHFQQFKYWGLNDPAGAWVVEGQARSIQDKICIGGDRPSALCFDDIATGYAGYVGEVNGYLGNPATPVNQASYGAALFWTYLTEKYGTSAPSDAAERGMNLIVEFWKESAANPGRDGIAVLNSTLATLGHSQRFRDIWKDFAVANYAKNISGGGVPAKYRYADMGETGGSYAAPMLTLSQNLNLNQQIVATDQTVYAWAARYYEVRPAATVPVIDIRFTQDTTGPLYYTILGIRGNDLVYEYNVEARHLNRTLVNDSYTRVVVIVAGLENLANYRYSFNGTQPTLRILTPTTANKARVGSPASPDKFRVAVEVLAGDGTPLAGVNLANFSFRVGTVEVPAANVLTSAHVQGQQWFVLRAPGQSSAGQYDLLVRYGAILSDTEPLAVDYTPRSDADNMLVIDRSGSMGSNGKLDAAKSAARLFVDSWRAGDQLGIVSFAGSPTLDMQLVPWTDSPSGGSRQDALDTINGLTAGGATAIGDALREGWDELIADGDNAHDWALVLLSDGVEEGPHTESFDQLIQALVDTTGKRPVVHTVALGPMADGPRMQNAANATGGTYQYVSLPAPLDGAAEAGGGSTLRLDMDARYRMIATKIAAQQQFFQLVGPLADGNPRRDDVPIPVENGAAELVLSLSWDGVVGALYLSDSGGTLHAPFHCDWRHCVWRVASPLGGVWTLTIHEYVIGLNKADSAPLRQGNEGLPPYYVQAAVRSDVTMEVALTTPPEARTPGAPIHFIASLTDLGPIQGATVIARVQRPDGGVAALFLRDDGAHGDGAAGDGLYGGTFYQTGTAGFYNVMVEGTGSSPLSGPFARQELLAFYVASGGDRDGDGLPDEWEVLYGTDPDFPDGGEDPDNDGSSNSTEHGNGTDPHDPDTDDGGETDSTDPNPHDPSDDQGEPTWAVAYPGDRKVFVRYAPRPEYDVVGLFRSEGLDGPYSFQQQQFSVTGMMTDTAVVNGTTYCYYVLAIDFQTGARTPSLAPSCATPRGDPWAPQGGLVINGGAATTPSRDVTLTLWATDSVDPHLDTPDELDDLLVPPESSESGVTEMQISNRADLSDAAWQPYAPTKAWTLPDGAEIATVYARFRDAAGNESEVVHATIEVVEGGPGGHTLFLPVTRR